jgi:hypothetical protein
MNKNVLFIIPFIFFSCLPPSPKHGSLSDTISTDSNVTLNNGKLVSPIQQIGKQDPARIKSLKKYFRFSKDEFDVNKKEWIKPTDAPKFVNRNAIYAYFQTINGNADNLRFVIQYHNEDWLFIEKFQFSIDGKAYEYIPERMETDNADGMIWEWFDDSADTNLKTIMEAIANSKTTKIKMLGRQYFDVKLVTKKQKESIKRTLEFYHVLGGT